MKNIRFIPLLLLALSAISCEKDPVAPPVQPGISINDATMFEGTGSPKMTFKVSLNTQSTEEVTVTFATQNGVAVEGEDFAATTGTVRFSPGEVTQSLEIVLVGDSIREADETFTVILSNPVNAYLADTTAIGTLKNDDTFTIIDDAGYQSATSYPGKTLVWTDEFEGAAPDEATWTYEIGNGCPNLCGWGNNELEYYTDRSENARQTQGKLIIEARKEGYSGYSYTSARMISRDKQSFQFGRIDIRAKLPEGQGIWPALWMLGQNIGQVPWPKSGEIDIMELVGNQPSIVHGTVHFGDAAGNRIQLGTSTFLGGGKKFSDEFHVFSLDWRQDTIDFLMDDKRYHRVTRTSVEASGGVYPFNAEFFFIMNVATGGTWPGAPDATTVFPQQMLVDYIRVFQ